MRRPFLLTLPLLLGLAGPASAADLVLKRVMLSSAGVGYFEYEAAVEGPTTLGLDLPLDQIDDVLKSLVVFDSAGSIGGVELPGHDATHAAFAAVPVGPEALKSPVEYLNGLRGVVVQVSGPRPMTGRILSAERMREEAREAGDTGTPRTRVTLLAADGLRQFVLEEADAVTVADPALRDGIDQALDSLRQDSRADARHLTIRSDGTGARIVRVGYVAAVPLWKASYRLVLPARNEESAKARLQGWAVLENATAAGRILGKPGDRSRCVEQLHDCSARTVSFLTAVAVLKAGEAATFEFLDTTRVRFRRLDTDTIARYVASESPLDCAAGFKSEGLGIALCESIDSNDPTALIGLPLIRLAAVLREIGFQVP